MVSGDCSENFHWGLAILVSLIIKLSPELTCHGVGRGLHVNP